MKKKIFAGMLALCLTAALTGCGADAPAEAPDTTAPETSTIEESTLPKIFTLFVQAKGAGSIAYAEEGGTPVFNEENPSMSVEFRMSEPATYVLAAKPDKGAKFVKWTKDGEDYSKETQITVTVQQDAELVAVFTDK